MKLWLQFCRGLQMRINDKYTQGEASKYEKKGGFIRKAWLDFNVLFNDAIISLWIVSRPDCPPVVFSGFSFSGEICCGSLKTSISTSTPYLPSASLLSSLSSSPSAFSLEISLSQSGSPLTAAGRLISLVSSIFPITSWLLSLLNWPMNLKDWILRLAFRFFRLIVEGF